MHTLKLTGTHQVGNSCRYLSLIDCRRGFARPPRSVQYYGKFPTLTSIGGLKSQTGLWALKCHTTRSGLSERMAIVIFFLDIDFVV